MRRPLCIGLRRPATRQVSFHDLESSSYFYATRPAVAREMVWRDLFEGFATSAIARLRCAGSGTAWQR